METNWNFRGPDQIFGSAVGAEMLRILWTKSLIDGVSGAECQHWNGRQAASALYCGMHYYLISVGFILAGARNIRRQLSSARRCR